MRKNENVKLFWEPKKIFSVDSYYGLSSIIRYDKVQLSLDMYLCMYVSTYLHTYVDS